MFKACSDNEKLILKKAFNKWGIFHIFNEINLLIKDNNYNNLADQNNLTDHSIPKVVGNFQNTSNQNQNDINKNNLKKKIKSSVDNEVYICANKRQMEMTIKLQPFSSGLNIGIIKNNSKKFIFNLNFAEIVLSNRDKIDFPFVCVNDTARNLVLYGRDIIGKSIESYYKEIIENQVLLILSKKKELLGIGRSRYSQELILQSEKVTVDNLQNIGTFYMKEENNQETSK